MKKNQIVTLEILNLKSTEGENISLSTFFTTEMNPMLSSITRIQQEIGGFLDGINEDIINQLILRYSNEIIEVTICDINNPIWILRAQNWVTYSVSIDLLYNSPSFKSESAGKVYKKLGDFAISKDAGSADSSSPLGSLIKKLECELFKIDLATRKCTAPLPSCEGLDMDLLSQMMIDRQQSHMVVKGELSPNRPMMGRTFDLRGSNPTITGAYDYYRRRYYHNGGKI